MMKNALKIEIFMTALTLIAISKVACAGIAMYAFLRVRALHATVLRRSPPAGRPRALSRMPSAMTRRPTSDRPPSKRSAA